MKKTLIIPFLSLCAMPHLNAQNWLTTGNAATAANFLGTTNTTPLILKVNNNIAGRIEEAAPSLTASANANTSIGYLSLSKLTTGYNNTAAGAGALALNTGGYYNVAVGYYGLYYNTTGTYNTTMGTYSMFYNTTGVDNTAYGGAALIGNTTGGDNVGIGKMALDKITTGFLNTGLGYGATPSNVNSYNWTGIGSFAGGSYSVNNSVELGNTSCSKIWGEVPMTTYSDQRIKDNIKANVPGLDFINRLRPVTYNLNIHRQNAIVYKDKPETQADWDGKYDIEKMTMTGFIAQEVDKAAQDAGYDFSGVDKPATPDGLYGIRYSEFIMPLVKAVQELSSANDALKKQNDGLASQYNDLKAMVLEMQQSMSQCCPNYQASKTTDIQNTAVNQQPVLEQNFPNPTNNISVIRCSVPGTFKAAAVKVYSSVGSEILSFPIQQAGINSFTINGNSLAAGVYQYSLFIDGNVIDTKKMVLTK